MNEAVKPPEPDDQAEPVPMAPLDAADTFEPTIEESILASGLHIQNAWEPTDE